MGKRPNIGEFREVLRKKGGNITNVAVFFKVSRKTIHEWANKFPEYKDAIQNERGALVDECLVSARILALGIPEKDTSGKFVGWVERPDGSMIRYLLSTLGRKEGFGEGPQVDDDIPPNPKHGVSIDSWIKGQVGEKDNKEVK
jgi:hypothetical protein